MSCESVRELLPDFTLGTLPDGQVDLARRHLRGCASCRAEASAMDEGVALFASAAHAAEPPTGLKDRVLAVLADEWTDTEVPARRSRRWMAMAAAAVIAAGALAWGGAAQIRSNRLAGPAQSYQAFLEALGGLDVRVATLRPTSSSSLEGSAVLYDSERGQSWVLVLLRSPATLGTVNVSVTGNGRTIPLRPVDLSEDDDGATWLVTAADISSIRTVRVTDDSGRLLASGRAAATETD